ncbi:hypothetical protein ABK040_006122 [Willaertia magna]
MTTEQSLQQAFVEYLQSEECKEFVQEFLSSPDKKKQKDSSQLLTTTDKKKKKDNLYQTQKIYKLLQTLTKNQSSIISNNNNLTIQNNHTLRSDIKNSPLLMKILSNEMERFRINIYQMKRNILQEKKTIVKKKKNKEKIIKELFNFNEISNENKTLFLRYLINYLLKDKKNIQLIYLAMNNYLTIYGMNNLYNNEHFWKYFINNYFIQNEYLKLLIRKFKRKEIKTENEIVLKDNLIYRNILPNNKLKDYIYENTFNSEIKKNITKKEINKSTAQSTIVNNCLQLIDKYQIHPLQQILNKYIFKIEKLYNKYKKLYHLNLFKFLKLYEKQNSKKIITFKNYLFKIIYEEKELPIKKIKEILIHPNILNCKDLEKYLLDQLLLQKEVDSNEFPVHPFLLEFKNVFPNIYEKQLFIKKSNLKEMINLFVMKYNHFNYIDPYINY